METNTECHNPLGMSFRSEISLHWCSGSAVVASNFLSKAVVLPCAKLFLLGVAGRGSSEVLPMKGLQFWGSPPFSGEGEGKKLQGCCHKCTDRPAYFFLFVPHSLLWGMESFRFAPSLQCGCIYDQWWWWNYFYYFLLSHLCLGCALLLCLMTCPFPSFPCLQEFQDELHLASSLPQTTKSVHL